MSRAFIQVVASCVLLAGLHPVMADDTPSNVPTVVPKLLRVVVIDDSGSMATDNRIGVVRDENTKQLQQLPPSPEFPVAVVTFGTEAQPARTFVDLKSSLEFINSLSASSGGTNMAAGLAEANTVIAKMNPVPSVWVMLYSDGEDANADGILAEEAKLDALFTDRTQRGLDQTVVFCKRWGGSNAQLQQQIEKRGRARVIDAGEAQLKTVTMEPRLTVHEVRWSKDKTNWIEVSFTPSVALRGGNAKQKWSPLKLTCQTPDAEGDRAFDVGIGTAEVRRMLRLPVPSDLQGQSEFAATFEVTEPGAQQSSDGVLVPLLAGTLVSLPIKLPLAKTRLRVTADCDLAEAPRWLDPLLQKAVYPVVLNVEVQADADVSTVEPTVWRLIPSRLARIHGGESSVKVAGLGKFSFPVSLELTPPQLASDLKRLAFDFELMLKAENVSASIELEPSVLTVKRSQLAPPPAVKTRITARVQSTSVGRWSDLRRAIASHALKIDFNVQGSMPNGTQITLVAPAEVQDLEFSPRVLRSGQQTIALSLKSEAKPRPSVAEIALKLVSPGSSGAIAFECQDRLVLKLPGPKPVRLLVGQSGEFASVLMASANDNVELASLPVEPFIAGIKQQRMLGGLQVAVSSKDFAVAAHQSQPLDFFSPTTIPMQLPSRPRSFFYDTRIDGDLQFHPEPATPAVIGSRYPVTVVVEAPFKRLLAILAITTSSVLAVVLLCWMVAKLRHQRS